MNMNDEQKEIIRSAVRAILCEYVWVGDIDDGNHMDFIIGGTSCSPHTGDWRIIGEEDKDSLIEQIIEDIINKLEN